MLKIFITLTLHVGNQLLNQNSEIGHVIQKLRLNSLRDKTCVNLYMISSVPFIKMTTTENSEHKFKYIQTKLQK